VGLVEEAGDDDEKHVSDLETRGCLLSCACYTYMRKKMGEAAKIIGIPCSYT
jgi:hypothetical protein